MNQHILFLFCFVSLFSSLSAQSTVAKDYIIAGNQNYQQKDFPKAELNYRQALKEDQNSIKANFNLGNALFEQKKYNEARAHFDKVIQNQSSSSAEKHMAFHNIGKTFFDEKNYEQAVANYKQALIQNPNDDETRYNYALARKLLEEQQENQNEDQNNQDQEDQNDQNEDQNQDSQDQNQSDQDGNEENQDQQGQNPQNDDGQQEGGQNGNKEGQGQQPQQNTISKGSDGKGNSSPQSSNLEYQENLLEALRQQEQETLKRIISQKAEKVRVNTEKDW